MANGDFQNRETSICTPLWAEAYRVYRYFLSLTACLLTHWDLRCSGQGFAELGEATQLAPLLANNTDGSVPPTGRDSWLQPLAKKKNLRAGYFVLLDWSTAKRTAHIHF